MIRQETVSLKTGFMLGVTVLFTYMLMVMGTFVTSTGSGLACPDWPLCYGTVVPPLRLSIWFEWGHRLLGGLTALSVLVSTFLVWKNYRGIPRVLTSIILGLLAFAVALGALIVLIEAPMLSSVAHLAIISSHLIIATIVLTCLIFTLRYVLKGRAATQSAHFKLLFGAVYLQVILGIIVRYSHSTLACADFPLCNGSIIPVMDNHMVALHFAHRVGALLVFSISASLLYRAFRDSVEVKAFTVVFMLVLSQAFFGIMIIKTAMFLPVIMLHGATGFMLLGLLAYKSMPHLFRFGAGMEKRDPRMEGGRLP